LLSAKATAEVKYGSDSDELSSWYESRIRPVRIILTMRYREQAAFLELTHMLQNLRVSIPEPTLHGNDGRRFRQRKRRQASASSFSSRRQTLTRRISYTCGRERAEKDTSEASGRKSPELKDDNKAISDPKEGTSTSTVD
jgi:hypothetical protein